MNEVSQMHSTILSGGEVLHALYGLLTELSLVQSAGKLLPAQLHARLTEEELSEGRVIVMGDVHGCLDELEDMLDEVDFVEGNDTVILVGDLVDKGPYSLEVIYLCTISITGHTPPVP